MSATADYIREAREQKGLTLDQAADATRIPQYYLEILEGGGNDRLVSDRLYMVHFLRTYAAYLEIEVETLAAQFVRENRAVDASPAPPETKPRSRKAATVAVLVVLLVVAAGLYIYDPTLVNVGNLVRTLTERPDVGAPPADAPPEIAVTPSSPAPVATQTPLPSTDQDSVLQPEADETAPAEPGLAGSPPAADPEPAAAPEPSAEPVAAVENAPAVPADPAEAQPETPRELAATPAPERTAAEETAAASETGETAEPRAEQTQPEVATASAEPAEAAPAETEPATTVAASGLEPAPTDGAGATHTLTIVADARSWLRIWVDDKPSRDFMLNPGQSATLSADTGFSITFGNAGGVRLKFNEEELPAVGRSGQVIRNYKLPRPEQANP
ncbi:MAG: DUF4115 domain-containing protein [Deltaproteobacteria bacterium]|nr:DUF4115 domain-containing protein [Deltaproteobacteria bacterium]